MYAANQGKLASVKALLEGVMNETALSVAHPSVCTCTPLTSDSVARGIQAEQIRKYWTEMGKPLWNTLRQTQ